MEYLIVGKHRFEIVKKFPKGYVIWNIGKNMKEGYLPLCKVIPGTYNVEINTLKAIKIDGAQKILDVSSYGVNTVRDAERYINKHKDARPGTMQYVIVMKMREALPVLREIKWE